MNDVTRILSTIELGDPTPPKGSCRLIYDELRQAGRTATGTRAAGADAPGDRPGPRSLLEAGRKRRGTELERARSFLRGGGDGHGRILIERARRKRRQIHGGGRQRRELHPDIVAATEPNEDLLALDTALAKFAERDPVKARLVELR